MARDLIATSLSFSMGSVSWMLTLSHILMLSSTQDKQCYTRTSGGLQALATMGIDNTACWLLDHNWCCVDGDRLLQTAHRVRKKTQGGAIKTKGYLRAIWVYGNPIPNNRANKAPTRHSSSPNKTFSSRNRLYLTELLAKGTP